MNVIHLVEVEHAGNLSAAARSAKIPRTTLNSRYYTAKLKEADAEIVQDEAQVGATHKISVEIPEGMICSADDLLKRAGYDPDLWIATRLKANAWPAALGEQRVAQFQQITVWAERILPAGLRPVQPLHSIPREVPKSSHTGADLLLCIPDAQIGHWWGDGKFQTLRPMHDRAVLDIGRQLAAELQPKELCWLGDNFDFSIWSQRFLREPQHAFTTQPAIDEGYWWFAQYRQAAPSARFRLLEGNHDKRLREMMASKVAEAYNLRRADGGAPVISLPHLLALDSLDIEYVDPYERGFYPWDDTFVHHGQLVKQNGTSTALLQKEPGKNHIFGHVHRNELAWRTTHHSHGLDQHFAVSPGCAARIEEGVVPGFIRRFNWQNALLLVESVDGQRWPHLIPVINGRARFRGKTYHGQSCCADIIQATGWEQLQEK